MPQKTSGIARLRAVDCYQCGRLLEPHIVQSELLSCWQPWKMRYHPVGQPQPGWRNGTQLLGSFGCHANILPDYLAGPCRYQDRSHWFIWCCCTVLGTGATCITHVLYGLSHTWPKQYFAGHTYVRFCTKMVGVDVPENLFVHRLREHDFSCLCVFHHSALTVHLDTLSRDIGIQRWPICLRASREQWLCVGLSIWCLCLSLCAGSLVFLLSSLDSICIPKTSKCVTLDDIGCGRAARESVSAWWSVGPIL